MKSIIQIVLNKDNKYPGDLKHYLRVIWHSPNLLKPYHGLRHMLHVFWDTYYGALYYGEKISPRTLRNMLIAALFHDYNHCGKTGNDAANIALAIEGLKQHILPIDEPYLDEIVSYIKATEYPHKEGEMPLPALIIRDADISYTLSDTWIQLVNFQLNREMGLSPEEMLRSQQPFLEKYLKFSTEWAEKKYSDRVTARIEEVKDMVKVIYGE